MPTKFPKSDFVIPPVGTQHSVCVDVVDHGIITTKFGTRPKLELCFQTAAKMKDGRPFLASQWYHFTDHENGTLRKHLEGWRNRPFTKAELRAFDFDTLVGKNCILVIEHFYRPDGSPMYKITGIRPSLKSLPVLVPVGYTPKPKPQAPTQLPAGDIPPDEPGADVDFETQVDVDDEEIPF